MKTLSNEELHNLLDLYNLATTGKWLISMTTRAGHEYKLYNIPGLEVDETGLCVWENMKDPDRALIAQMHDALPDIILELLRLRAIVRENKLQE